MNNIRLQYLDALKVFAIFVVVWAHLIPHWGESVVNSNIHIFIYSFHMPLFAFVSGYFLSIRKGIWQSVFNKCKRLGVPLVTWSVLSFIIRYLFIEQNTEFHLMAVVRNLYYHIAKWDFWYLRALLLSFIVAFLSLSVYKNKIISLTLSYLLLQTLFLLGVIKEENPIAEFNGFIFLYPFVCLGAIFKDIEPKIEKYENYIVLVLIVVYAILLAFWQIDYTFYHTRLCVFAPENKGSVDWRLLFITVYRLLIGIVASLTFYLLFKRIRNLKIVKSSIVASLSNATLSIYITHFTLVCGGWFSFKYPQVIGCEAFFVVLSVCVVLTFMCFCIYKLTSPVKILSFLLWGESFK